MSKIITMVKILIMILIVVSSTLGITGFVYSQNRAKVENGFYLNGENEINLEYGQKYEEAGFIASIDSKSYTRDVNVDSNVNINKLGNYEIKYTLNYRNYEKTLVRRVNVVDHTFPTLSIKCDMEQYVALKSKMKACKVSAVDNYDNNITDKIVVDSDLNMNKVGDYTVTYTVSDSSNNKVSKSVKVHVRNKDDLTYVIVYISKQKLLYYKDRKLVLSTPITSGRNNYTKTGKFRIINKARDATLTGPDYTSFVQYWMGYGGGYGLHDASWRSRFGTQDYTVNGSHGCINMPTSAARKLYGIIEVGTAVYIKK